MARRRVSVKLLSRTNSMCCLLDVWSIDADDVYAVCLQAYPSAFQPTLLAAALPAAPGSAAASLLSLAGGGVAAAPTRLAIAAANGHQQPPPQHVAQLAPSSSPSSWAAGAAGQNGPCSTLFVANLGHSCTEAQLTDLFQRSVPPLLL